MEEFDPAQLVEVFAEESEEHLTLMEGKLVTLETSPKDPETLDAIFRVAHTLKGNAAAFGYSWLKDFAHVLEDLLDGVRGGTVPVTRSLVSLLLECVDSLRRMVKDAIAGHADPRPADQALLKRLARRRGQAEPGAQRATAAASTEPILAGKRTLRVDVSKLDRLLNLAGEIAVARGRLRQLIEGRSTVLGEEIVQAQIEADRLQMDLQEQVMSVRMVPLGPTFQRFTRTVRDTAAASGKQALLTVEGEDVEVDTTVIEHIKDPLTHMIRNSLDHGIETPARREASGKDPCGRLVLRAFRDAGGIVIALEDDGAGLNRRRIEERARSRGIAEPERLSDREIYRQIFEPGFTTAQAVTDLSGRGVGLDVVRRNIDALGGSVEVDSREGRGVTFTIRMPLTLAVIEGFLVSAGRETYVLPMNSVVECLDASQEGLGRDGEGVVSWRGHPLPSVRLARLFGEERVAGSRESLVVVASEAGEAGIVVDGLLGESEVVIKPLGPIFKGIPGLSGCTVLGSGRVALILDVPSLIRHVASRAVSARSGAEVVAVQS